MNVLPYVLVTAHTRVMILFPTIKDIGGYSTLVYGIETDLKELESTGKAEFNWSMYNENMCFSAPIKQFVADTPTKQLYSEFISQRKNLHHLFTLVDSVISYEYATSIQLSNAVNSLEITPQEITLDTWRTPLPPASIKMSDHLPKTWEMVLFVPFSEEFI